MFNRWRLIIGGVALGSVITAGIFLVPPVVASKSWPLKWPDWSGIGEDIIKKESTEKKGGENGPIEKFTSTDEYQSGKTIWDLLELLAVPLLLLCLSNRLQKKDKEVADINLREEALQNYLDRVSDLLIDNKVNSLEPNDPLLELINDIIRTRTLTILRSLDKDGERKGMIIRFLIDAELINNWDSIKLNLSSANLKGAKLSGTQLSRVQLIKADLSDADLSYADLSNAKLRDAKLRNANLSNADLTGVDLTSADLRDANLSDANLSGADLSSADLRDAKVTNANLSNAHLISADFRNAELSNINLSRAILKGVKELPK